MQALASKNAICNLTSYSAEPMQTLQDYISCGRKVQYIGALGCSTDLATMIGLMAFVPLNLIHNREFIHASVTVGK